MKERIRWIAIGFGFMVGIQVLASLMLIGLGQMPERSPGISLSSYWAFLIFGLTLAAFFLADLSSAELRRCLVWQTL